MDRTHKLIAVGETRRLSSTKAELKGLMPETPRPRQKLSAGQTYRAAPNRHDVAREPEEISAQTRSGFAPLTICERCLQVPIVLVGPAISIAGG